MLYDVYFFFQSPNALKSVVQAAWLMTSAVGNLIVVIISEMNMFEKIVSKVLFSAQYKAFFYLL